MVEMYALYEKRSGSGTEPSTYCMKGIFASPERAKRMGKDLVFDHDWYEPEIQPIKIPDEAVAIMVASAMDNLSAEELKSIVNETGDEQ